jgi:uncharacterized protein YciI
MSTVDHPASANPDRYFLIFLTTVPGKTPSPEVLANHAAHLSLLDRCGVLVLAGPVPERGGGMIALRVASMADAKAIADDEPFVRGGYQTYELGTWVMSNLKNRYRPDLQQERQK